MPKQKRDAIEQEEEIFNYLHQSHISEKNIGRLKTLAASSNPQTAELAAIAIEGRRSNHTREGDSRSWLENEEICSMRWKGQD